MAPDYIVMPRQHLLTVLMLLPFNYLPWYYMKNTASEFYQTHCRKIGPEAERKAQDSNKVRLTRLGEILLQSIKEGL